MSSPPAFSRFIDALSERTGQCLSWISLLMMLVLSAVVVLRYAFDYSHAALSESVTYMHAAAFMLGAAFTLKHSGHVRVDIFYRRFSERQRAWVDALGSIVLLLPFCLCLVIVSWEFVQQSWSMSEGSPEPGGIPAIYLLKTLIPMAGFTLALQGLAELIKNCARLMALSGDTNRG